MAPLSRVVPVDVGYPIVGCRTVSFDCFMVFPFVDDDNFRTATNIDNIVQVAAGVVKGVAKLLVVFCLEIYISLLVLNLLRVAAQVDSDRDSWRWWRDFVADCYCCGRLCFSQEIIVIEVF